MKKLLATIFALGIFGTANAATVTIGVDTFDVGEVDHLVAIGEQGANSNPETETTWVNDTLNGINPNAPTVEYTVKTEDVPYYETDDVTGVYAFTLVEPVPDFFLVKNSTDIALFQNNVDLGWGVFNIAEMEGFHLGDDFTISHVTQFDIDDGDRNVVPVPPAVWLFGSGLLGLVGVARRKD